VPIHVTAVRVAETHEELDLGEEVPDHAQIDASLEELPGLLADPHVHVWVNVDEQNDEVHRLFEEVFEFHPLLIEDAFADANTPKLEDFDDYLYLIVHGLVDADPEGDREVHTADLDIFVGRRFVITHHRLEFAMVDEVWRRGPPLLAKGPAFVAHAIIDGLVDEFLPLMEKLDVEIDEIETAILDERGDPRLLESIFRMKHSLNRIRRVGLHQQRLLEKLSRHPGALIPGSVRPFFADVYDHFVKVIDLNEVYRDLIASSVDAYLSMQSHRLNEVMRILTVISTVMLPLTFITGLYGMNFDYMPYLHWDYGFEMAVASMLLIAGGMVVFFRRQRWL
jgi:magnesium transporter